MVEELNVVRDGVDWVVSNKEGVSYMKNYVFENLLVEKGFLIMVHRGLWGGNIIQNTRQAAQLAMKAGADIVEVDVCRSKDGEYYLFHNGNEKYLLGVEVDFSQLESSQIDTLKLLNSVKSPSGYYAERLADFLDWLPSDYLINIDRSWNYWEDPKFIELLKQSGKTDQLIVKSPAKATYLEALSQLSQSGLYIAYIPIIYKREDYELVEQYPSIKVVGAELIVNELNQHELLDPFWLKPFIEENLILLANSEHLGEDYYLFAELNDSQAILNDEDEIWGRMLDLGINVIQTDWPNFLYSYRQYWMSHRKVLK